MLVSRRGAEHLPPSAGNVPGFVTKSQFHRSGYRQRRAVEFGELSLPLPIPRQGRRTFRNLDWYALETAPPQTDTGANVPACPQSPFLNPVHRTQPVLRWSGWKLRRTTPCASGFQGVHRGAATV